VKAFIPHPQSLFLRRALFQVHLWVGILAGLYIFVVCITGAALVFRVNLRCIRTCSRRAPKARWPIRSR
jgi:uncharacterized iron-regulated membrane protein